MQKRERYIPVAQQNNPFLAIESAEIDVEPCFQATTVLHLPFVPGPCNVLLRVNATTPATQAGVVLSCVAGGRPKPSRHSPQAAFFICF
jgi:hypothetical protein